VQRLATSSKAPVAAFLVSDLRRCEVEVRPFSSYLADTLQSDRNNLNCSCAIHRAPGYKMGPRPVVVSIVESLIP